MTFSSKKTGLGTFWTGLAARADAGKLFSLEFCALRLKVSLSSLCGISSIHSIKTIVDDEPFRSLKRSHRYSQRKCVCAVGHQFSCARVQCVVYVRAVSCTSVAEDGGRERPNTARSSAIGQCNKEYHNRHPQQRISLVHDCLHRFRHHFLRADSHTEKNVPSLLLSQHLGFPHLKDRRGKSVRPLGVITGTLLYGTANLSCVCQVVSPSPLGGVTGMVVHFTRLT